MNNKTKPMRKKLLARVFLVIGAVSCLFALAVINVSALNYGVAYYDNVWSGKQSYTYSTINSLKYTSLGTDVYWRDAPTTDVYQIDGQTNWRGLGQPLASGVVYSQNVFENQFYQGLVNPDIFDPEYFPQGLDNSYSLYRTHGLQDYVRTVIKNNKPSSYTGKFDPTTIAINFGEQFFTHEMFFDYAGTPHEDGYSPNYRLYAPELHIFMDNKDKRVPILIKTSIEYVVSGALYSVSVNSYTTPRQSTLPRITINPYYEAYVSLTPEQQAGIKYSSMIKFGEMEVIVGDNRADTLERLRSGVYTDGVKQLIIFQGALRPYNSTSGLTHSPEGIDINYELHNMWSDVTAGITDDEVNLSRLGTFASNVVGSFLSLQIFPGFTLGGILFTILSITLTVSVLKFFAGG